MAREDAHFRLRIPDALRAKVEAAAQEARRSMTAEIIARLEQSFDLGAIALAERVGEMDGFIADHEKAIADHEKRIADLERLMSDACHMSGWRDYPENERD